MMTPAERADVSVFLGRLIKHHRRPRLARALGISPTALSKWAVSGIVPPERVPELIKATVALDEAALDESGPDKVKGYRHDPAMVLCAADAQRLRPDLYPPWLITHHPAPSARRYVLWAAALPRGMEADAT